MKKISVLFLAFCLSGSLWAQSKSKEGNIWYFGEKAGVSFASGIAEPLQDGLLFTDEGCATIANAQGELLFYTDGSSVWDKTHQLMPNGSKLNGNASSTSSAVAIPAPNKPGLYYLFTVDATAGDKGFCYSVVDMRLNEGKGDIVAENKNFLLATKVTEKLTAVKHRNGKDIWVIVHEWETDIFLAYLVGENGVSTKPITSRVGSVHKGGSTNTQGYMKSNPDGTNIALALEDEHKLELFDFNNETGILSNPISIQQPKGSYTYGIEFSPNGSLLYASAAGTGAVYQYNLQAGSPEAIVESAFLVGKTADNKWIGALQIAPDGKIYFPIYQTSFLGVIHEPNQLGEACAYENNYTELAKRNSRLGLPTFSQSFFEVKTETQKISTLDLSNPKNSKNPPKIELGKTYLLKNILFETAKYDLLPASFVELDKLVSLMQANPKYVLEISGHTDNVGNKSMNLTLSKNRAKAVQKYLNDKKIPAERIRFFGFGSQKPVSDNSTDEGRQLNRRVEFKFLDK